VDAGFAADFDIDRSFRRWQWLWFVRQPFVRYRFSQTASAGTWVNPQAPGVSTVPCSQV